MPAPDSQALTLVEWAALANEPRVQKITYSLYENNNILGDIPLILKRNLKLTGRRLTGNLPTPAWRDINELPVAFRTKPTEYSESRYLVRNKVQIDRDLYNDPDAFEDLFDFNWNAYMEGFAADFNWKFFNNNHGIEPKAPIGLRYRLDNAAAFGIPTELKLDGGAVDLSPTTMTAATARRFFYLINLMLSRLGRGNGDGVTIYGNNESLLAATSAVQISGAGAGFRNTTDAFDRSVDRWKEATFKDAGRRADQTSNVLGFETAAGVDDAAGKHSSLYFVRYGRDSFYGWQDRLMRPSEPKLDPIDETHYNSNLHWSVGLMQPNIRAVGRIFGIKVRD